MIRHPWFWAFVAMIGWCLGFLLIGSRRFGSRLWFGVIALITLESGKLMLPLPFVIQPRFEGPSLAYGAAGGVILFASLLFAMPVLRIHGLTRPNRTEPLRTGGLYSLVRHPIMICETFWPCGWALIHRSVIGVALTVVWIIIADLATRFEEEKMIQEYGDAYREYQRRVPRLFPSWRLFRNATGRFRPKR